MQHLERENEVTWTRNKSLSEKKKLPKIHDEDWFSRDSNQNSSLAYIQNLTNQISNFKIQNSKKKKKEKKRSHENQNKFTQKKKKIIELNENQKRKKFKTE